MKNTPYISYEQALDKLKKFCAYQDRCHKEVRQKLFNLGVYGDWQDEIIVELISEKFLDEQRFSNSFVRGKFRIKKWGRNRIIQELKLRGISSYCIKKAMQEIEQEAYAATLEELILKKNRVLNERNNYKRKHKLAKYIISKGFEAQLVWDFINTLIKD